jgi:hypothetical protein
MLETKRASGVLIFTLFLAGVVHSTDSPPSTGPLEARTAIHVHSSFSNGEYSILELARMAATEGVGVLVLTDSLLTTVNYGLWPLDRLGINGLNRMVRPGVLDHGVDSYLAAVEEASKMYPDLVIVPGVEVAPYYRWVGRPWNRLELHGFDHHLWVVGLDADALRNLPVIGNETWANTRLRWSRLALPLGMLVIGCALLLWRRNRKWRRWPILLLLAAALLVAVNNWPYGVLGDSYSRDPVEKRQANQRLIDYVRDEGGLAYWSYPEAEYGEVLAGGAVMISAAHPEDLVATDRYHGFEGLYGDEISATHPGKEWDQVLLGVLGGERDHPPAVVTGIDFHKRRKNGDGWDTLTGGRTVLNLESFDVDGVLQALRTSQGYCTFQGQAERFRLDRFDVLVVPGGSLQVDMAMSWERDRPAGPRPFQVELILDGEVAVSEIIELPFERRFVLEGSPGPHYVRMQANAGRLNRLLSNPLFTGGVE